MLSNLQKGTISALIFAILTSCVNSKNDFDGKSDSSKNDVLLNRALVNGYYSIISDNLGVSVSNNKIYFLTNSKTGFGNETFLLHFVNNDNSFVNKDFKGEEYLMNDSLFNKFKNLSIIEVPEIDGDFKKIRIGQYIRLEDNSAQNIWVKEIPYRTIDAGESLYNNQFKDQLNKNLLQESFELSLRVGSFFKNAHAFYILYDDAFIYIISQKSDNLQNKFMLHFIKENNTFVNKSLFLANQQFQNQLEPPYSKLYITRVSIPNEPFYKIRIGQFNDNGNLWTQEFRTDEILSNPLLKYANEFEN
jgi:hypothetical protein